LRLRVFTAFIPRGAADCCEFREVAGAAAEAVNSRGRAEGVRRFAFPLPFWAFGSTGTSERNPYLLVTMDCCNVDKTKLGKIYQISGL
jgi:hypothetical protein